MTQMIDLHLYHDTVAGGYLDSKPLTQRVVLPLAFTYKVHRIAP